MSRPAALASLFGRPGAQSAATVAGLPSVRYVTTKEIADASGGALSERSVAERCLLFDSAPADPRALAYHRPFGRRPYFIRRDIALRFLGAEDATART